MDNVAPVDELSSRDYVLKGYKVEPKIAYLFSRNASWDLFCEFQNKENRIGNYEELKQTKIGASFTYASEKRLTMNGEFSLYQNKFKGDDLSVVAISNVRRIASRTKPNMAIINPKTLNSVSGY